MDIDINYNIRIFFKSFDFIILNKMIYKIIKLSKNMNIKFVGPIYLPIKKKRFNILSSPHVNKTSRDQLEISIYKRFLDFYNINKTFFTSVKEIYNFYNMDFYFEIFS